MADGGVYEDRQNRGALHFLNGPHINNKPLKISLSYQGMPNEN
jgi:hypothetical protein